MDSGHIGAKPVARTEELSLWDVTAEAEPKGDWFAMLIRRALQACTADVEPSPMTWDLIKKRIEASASALSSQEEIK